MHQTKKGNQWHFGMKVRAAVDAGTGYAVAASFTPANVHDICELHGLVRDGDTVVFADSGYRGCARRPEIASDPRLAAVDWRICAAPSRKRRLKGADREEERCTSSVRVHVEHLFALVQRTFGYSKARYRTSRRTPRGYGRCWPAPTCPAAPAPAGRGSSWPPRPPERPTGAARDAPPGP